MSYRELLGTLFGAYGIVVLLYAYGHGAQMIRKLHAENQEAIIAHQIGHHAGYATLAAMMISYFFFTTGIMFYRDFKAWLVATALLVVLAANHRLIHSPTRQWWREPLYVIVLLNTLGCILLIALR